MRTPEEIVLEHAQKLVKSGKQSFNSLEDIKDFAIGCCKQAQLETCEEILVEVRKRLGGTP